ncbi:YihY/virulence factor BrkB family protein [Microbacterium gorillae]|uniref:YihY/virulence factor BrkB family protein n=1 Tax=Microbacterium gorillae TaxID=1231063 RepID=UPI000693AE1A|nr:YihY/virulence factor BrkB family protein [Microbacterium gorillae]
MTAGPESASPPSGLLARAGEVSQRVLDAFPLRVWQRFQRRNGLLLASGTSDQAVFAVFAALYVAFAVIGIWLGASRTAIDGLIDMVNGFAPGLIQVSDHSPGIVPAQSIRDITTDSTTALSITGVLAMLAFIWTTVGWITFLRSSVRDIFGLQPVDANFALVKFWDFVAAVGFAILLGVGGLLTTVGTSALGLVFTWVDLPDTSVWFDIATRGLSFLVAFVVDVILLVSLYRFLAGTDLSLRRVLPGSLVGALGLIVLQISAGWLIGRAPGNPLVTTFAVLLGLLLWFRLAMIVILVAAAWIAESAATADIEIVRRDEYAHRVEEAQMLVDAAKLRLREARIERGSATYWKRGRSIRSVTRAREELADAQQRLNVAEIELAESRRDRARWRRRRESGA